MNPFADAPKEWTVGRVGLYCDVQLGKMLQNDPASENDQLKPYLRAINVAKDRLDLSHQFNMWIRPQELDRFRLKKGDILVSEGGDSGRTVIFDSDQEYYFQNAINRLRPDSSERVDSRFLYYWFTYLKLSGYVDLICNVATISHFTAEKVKASPLIIPSLDIQRQIAQFLDSKTEKINQLIDKKLELLDRLAEKRQALITQTVTRGLNPSLDVGQWTSNLPLHEMTECPENWSIKRLKYVATYNDEKLSEKTDEDKEIRYVEISDVSLLSGIELVSQMTFGESPSRARRIARGGDILVSTVRTYLRAIATVDESSQEGLVASTGFCVVRPADEVDGGFLGWAVKSEPFIAEVVSRSVGASYPGINADDLAKIEVPIPPIETQKKIASFLDEESAKIDVLVEKVNKMLGLLEEYRSALITSSVTGQIPKLLRNDAA